MGYAVLLLGLAIWSAAHLWKRVAPASRERLGMPGKGLVALLLVASIPVMAWGYGRAVPVDLWYPPEWLKHVNNLLTLIALWLFAGSNAGGRIAKRMRHPQLTAVKVWAVAHLLVNGSLAALILFGGLLAWAVAEVIVINRQSEWAPSEPGSIGRDIGALLIAVVLWLAIAYAHTWFGLWPFGGDAPIPT